MNDKILVQTEGLSKTFSSNSKGIVEAVKNVNLTIFEGETYGLIGQSGSGKSTLGNMILKLLKPTEGDVFFEGVDVNQIDEKQFRKDAQIIFQNPFSSLNPKQKIKDIISEPLKIHKITDSKITQDKLVNEIRTLSGISTSLMDCYPHELSGGQLQRVAIASSLILNPKFLILDEAVSALDVLIQAQILNMLKSMQKALGLTYLFISHDLNVISYLSDRIGVMYKGEIIEEGKTSEILSSPKCEYTKKLISTLH